MPAWGKKISFMIDLQSDCGSLTVRELPPKRSCAAQFLDGMPFSDFHTSLLGRGEKAMRNFLCLDKLGEMFIFRENCANFSLCDQQKISRKIDTSQQLRLDPEKGSRTLTATEILIL